MSDKLFSKSPVKKFDKNKVYIYSQNEEPFVCRKSENCPLNCICKKNKCFMLIDPDEDDLTTITGRQKYIKKYSKRFKSPVRVKTPPRRLKSPASPFSPLSPNKFKKVDRVPKKIPKTPIKQKMPMLSYAELENIQNLIQKRFEKKRDKIERKNALKDQFVPKNTPVISIRK